MLPIVFKVGIGTSVPNEAAVYQVTFCPGSGVIAETALRVCIGDNSHWVILPLEAGANGAGFIVNVTAVLESEEQPSFDSA